MNSKTAFALLLSAITCVAGAQTVPNSSSKYGVNTTPTVPSTGSTSVIANAGNTTPTTQTPGGIHVVSFGQAHLPPPGNPIVTPEPMTMMAFLPGLLIFIKRKKVSR